MMEAGYITMRVRRPFSLGGVLVQAGDHLTLPMAQARRLREERKIEHLLAVRSRLYPSLDAPRSFFFYVDGRVRCDVEN